MINRRLAVLFALVMPLTACVSGSDSVQSSPNPNAGFYARFSPLVGIMPFPNDLLFARSDGKPNKTGTLNILPIGYPTTGGNAAVAAMDHLDGFGTQSAITIDFTDKIDAATLASGVFVLQVTSNPLNKALTGFVKPLVVGTDYSIGLSGATDANGTLVDITPKKPLSGGSTYLVVVTTGVKNSSGNTVSPSTDYATILTADAPALVAHDVTKINLAATDPLLPVAQFTFAQLAVGIPTIQALTANPAFGPADIALTFSFSTQYTAVALPTLAATAAPTGQPANPANIVDTGKTAKDFLVLAKVKLSAPAAAAAATAEMFVGVVALPYYLPTPTTPTTDPTAPLTGFWQNAAGGDTVISASPATSELPKATVAKNVIPILVSIPNSCGAMPGSGWPVVIFQHGITRNREDMLAVAGSFAAPPACIAVVAIDLPLHGVVDKTDGLYRNQLFATTLPALVTGERTFDLDLENNTTGAPGSDGAIDPSGQWFINLTSLITSRDNLREGAADLINLTATLPTLAAITPPATVNTFDGSKIYFVGHSLGGIVGTDFLGADTASGSPKIVAATLGMPGGNVSNLLQNSPAFAPIINAGLAAQGVVAGTQFYDQFFSYAQAAIDDGDPANYAALASAGHPIHMIEVVGGFGGAGDTCNLPDQVVPNANTDLLASLMGLVQVNTTTPGGKFIVRFLVGDHGSILDPSVPANCTSNTTNQQLYGAATLEMQTEAVKWMLASGTAVSINNSPPIIK